MSSSSLAETTTNEKLASIISFLYRTKAFTNQQTRIKQKMKIGFLK
jgi:hypothetical protein